MSQNRTESLTNASENTSCQKHVFRSCFFGISGEFWGPPEGYPRPAPPLFTLQSPKISPKIQRIASGAPPGGENVILSELQYENHDCRGSEGPEISENHAESFKNVSENASSPKSVFRS